MAAVAPILILHNARGREPGSWNLVPDPWQRRRLRIPSAAYQRSEVRTQKSEIADPALCGLAPAPEPVQVLISEICLLDGLVAQLVRARA